MKIFYVNAPARTGKDTFCAMCKKFTRAKTVSTVDHIKIIARDFFDWDEVKDSKGRALLAALRYASGAYNDGPIKHIGKLIKMYPASTDILFIHVREHLEMMKMLHRYGGRTITVARNVELCPTEQEFINQRPDSFEFDFTINNYKTLEDLEDEAKKFCEEITHESC